MPQRKPPTARGGLGAFKPLLCTLVPAVNTPGASTPKAAASTGHTAHPEKQITQPWEAAEHLQHSQQFGEGFFLWDEISQADCLFSCYQLRNCIADKKCWGAYMTTVISKFKLCLAATTLKIFTIINLIFPLLFIVMNSV